MNRHPVHPFAPHLSPPFPEVTLTPGGGKRSRQIRLTIQSGGIQSTSVHPTLDPSEFPTRPLTIGTATELPPATFRGLADIADIAGCAQFLADGLELGSGILCLNDELTPGICRHPTGRFCVLMPVRVAYEPAVQQQAQAA